MPNIGTPELIIGLIVVFLLFGAKRMPDMARGIGQSLRIFKTEMQQPKAAEAATPPAPTAPDAQPAGSTPPAQPAAPTEPRPRPAQ